MDNWWICNKQSVFQKTQLYYIDKNVLHNYHAPGICIPIPSFAPPETGAFPEKMEATGFPP